MADVADHAGRRRRHYVIGVLLLFAAAVLWSLNGALIKLIYRKGDGLDGVTIAFYRSLVAGLFLLPLAVGKFHTLRSSRSNGAGGGGGRRDPIAPVATEDATRNKKGLSTWIVRPAGLSCVVFFTLMTVCFVVANTKTEAASAIILQYTSTFWVFGLSPLVLKERPRREDVWILGVAMVGIGIIFAGNAAADRTGLVIALGAGLFFGLLTLMIRRMRDSDSAAVTVLNNLGSAMLLFPAAVLAGNLLLSRRALILIIIMGVVQFGLPYYLYTLGLARVPAYQGAVITLAEPLLVPLWTYLAVGETLPPATVIGGGVILGALMLFVRSARRRAAHGSGGNPHGSHTSVMGKAADDPTIPTTRS